MLTVSFPLLWVVVALLCLILSGQERDRGHRLRECMWLACSVGADVRFLVDIL